MSITWESTNPVPLADLVERTAAVAADVRAGLYDVRADADERWHVRLYRDDCVDLWLISWTTEQGTQLHDHGGSGGAFTVVTGTLQESVWASGSRRLVDNDRNAGDTIGFGEHYVHDVRNVHEQTAVSVHAYSPPLDQMNFYDVERDEAGRRHLTRIAHLWTDDPEAELPDDVVPREQRSAS
ncbi:hypothetical protein [Aeromicrobium sp. CTD01-1L150]|uniref:hypothetical protein n=1 Tax=Aeromicrobium sp. CTD01-1L150 TaxID=3341830 RepID=UPI0035C216FE